MVPSKGMENATGVATELVGVERRGGVLFVTMNRPEAANALSKGLVAGLADTFTAAAHEDDLRAVVLTGAGEKAFCAGADLKERRGMTLAASP